MLDDQGATCRTQSCTLWAQDAARSAASLDALLSLPMLNDAPAEHQHQHKRSSSAPATAGAGARNDCVSCFDEAMQVKHVRFLIH